MKEVRMIAYQYASKNHTGIFGKKWTCRVQLVSCICRKKPNIELRKPEPLSIATGMNQPVVESWFVALSSAMTSLGIANILTHLWNVDETGLQDNFVPTKVIGETGKPYYQSISCERGTTAIAAFNATGQFVPTMIIFCGKQMKLEWIDGISKDVDLLLRMSDKGWVTSDLFLSWGRTFVSQLPIDGLNLPHIPFLDEHGSHVYN